MIELFAAIAMLMLVAPLAFAVWIVVKLRQLERHTETLRRTVDDELTSDLEGLSARLDALEATGGRGGPDLAPGARASATEEAGEVARPAGTGATAAPAREEPGPTPEEEAAAAGDAATAPARDEEERVTGAAREEEEEAAATREEEEVAAGRQDEPVAATAGGPAATPGTAPAGVGRADAAAGKAASVDLEELIGSDWMNRAGVLITVIGMALGLGYSFQYLGPAGRIGTSLVLALAMLATGVWLERRETYRTYGRGLIGGGWAALYVTTYAAHGVEAARVVDDPTLAAALLMAAALGMILHSLRYRSEVVTGTAFLVAFGTLAITDLSTFAVVASIPLAAALLFLAYRFGWGGLAALGVVSTYGTYMLSEGTLPVTGSAVGDFLAGQATLLAYWLLFEGFDLARLRDWLETELENDAGSRTAEVVAPLNAAGFVGISLLQWSDRNPDMVGWFAALATGLYLASALVRARLRPVDAGAGAGELATSGGYPVPVTIAAFTGALALGERYSGHTLTLALALEAEALFLAGLYLRQPFLRGLATAAFVLPWARLLGDGIGGNATVDVAGLELREWTPLALVMAAAAYLDRFLLHGRGPMASERAYTWVASWTLLIVMAAELPRATMELGWLLLAALLFEAGRAAGLMELRGQAYAVAGLGFVSLLALKIVGIDDGPTRPWVSLAPATASGYAAALYLGRVGSPLGERERALARNLLAAAGGVMAVGFLGHALPESLVTAGWAALGTALLAAGFPLGERMLRVSGLALLALCVLKVFVWDLNELDPPYRILSFLVLGLLLLGGSLVYTRSRERLRELLDGEE